MKKRVALILAAIVIYSAISRRRIDSPEQMIAALKKRRLASALKVIANIIGRGNPAGPYAVAAYAVPIISESAQHGDAIFACRVKGSAQWPRIRSLLQTEAIGAINEYETSTTSSGLVLALGDGLRTCAYVAIVIYAPGGTTPCDGETVCEVFSDAVKGLKTDRGAIIVESFEGALRPANIDVS